MAWFRGVLGDACCSILDLYARMWKKGATGTGDSNEKLPVARRAVLRVSYRGEG